jgi:hypothetical protein
MLELAIAMVICAFILGCMGFFGLAAGTAAITSRENRCLAIPLIAAAAELMYRSCSYMLLLTLLPTAVMFSMTNRLVQQVGGLVDPGGCCFMDSALLGKPGWV